jgi:hypothetical protein
MEMENKSHVPNHQPVILFPKKHSWCHLEWSCVKFLRHYGGSEISPINGSTRFLRPDSDDIWYGNHVIKTNLRFKFKRSFSRLWFLPAFRMWKLQRLRTMNNRLQLVSGPISPSLNNQHIVWISGVSWINISMFCNLQITSTRTCTVCYMQSQIEWPAAEALRPTDLFFVTGIWNMFLLP